MVKRAHHLLYSNTGIAPSESHNMSAFLSYANWLPLNLIQTFDSVLVFISFQDVLGVSTKFNM
jgi:hypothetical protein